ncbi:hypothetical protein Scep_018135 [Stephania cephalantha]|uniref:Uncharacterized protein n=1 Tax=Stephania cephalantha TaxID=152367 RepID=A0AAP0IQV7_9MAGN
MEANQVSVQIDSSSGDELFYSIKQKIHPMPSIECCIYRIPKCLRILPEEAYVPKIVSLGPFHKGRDSLLAMEEHKRWYLHALLSRASVPDQCLRHFLTYIRESEGQARASYAEAVNLYSDEFVEMILLDACFAIELFYNYGRVELRNDNDPIYITSWMLSSLKHDLILLENQLPFFVLVDLFDMIRDPDKGDLHLEEYVRYFFRDVLPPTGYSTHRYNGTHINHLLDFLHVQFFPDCGLTLLESEAGGQHIECATELNNAGMKFEATHFGQSLLDISLNKDGVFQMPLIYFDETVSYLMGNLIALEQCDSRYAPLVSSYVVLLDSLIASPKDVRLLRREAIIDSFFRDDEELVLIIKQLSKGLTVSRFLFAELYRQVNCYYHTDWNRWKANLRRDYIHTMKRDYFRTPWAFISFIAATVLLFLTLTQTIFTIIS